MVTSICIFNIRNIQNICVFLYIFQTPRDNSLPYVRNSHLLYISGKCNRRFQFNHVIYIHTILQINNLYFTIKYAMSCTKRLLVDNWCFPIYTKKAIWPYLSFIPPIAILPSYDIIYSWHINPQIFLTETTGITSCLILKLTLLPQIWLSALEQWLPL